MPLLSLLEAIYRGKVSEHALSQATLGDKLAMCSEFLATYICLRDNLEESKLITAILRLIVWFRVIPATLIFKGPHLFAVCWITSVP